MTAIKFEPKSDSEKVAEPRQKRVLDAAEQLFSARGFYGVTIRQVAELAGVDLALPNYYFGSKRGLFDAVFFRRADILNHARLEGIRAVVDKPSPVQRQQIADILRAFIAPVRDAHASEDAGWRAYCRLVAQVNASPEFSEMMSRNFDELIERLIGALRSALPGTPEQELYWCYHSLSGALTLTMANTGRIDKLSHGVADSSDVHNAYEHLIAVFTRAFCGLCRPRDPL